MRICLKYILLYINDLLVFFFKFQVRSEGGRCGPQFSLRKTSSVPPESLFLNGPFENSKLSQIRFALLCKWLSLRPGSMHIKIVLRFIQSKENWCFFRVCIWWTSILVYRSIWNTTAGSWWIRRTIQIQVF